MIGNLLWFLGGLIVGGTLGMIALALAIVAGDADRRMHALDPEDED